MIDSNLFTFKPYTDNREATRPGFTEGRSGPLLLATEKKTGKKYLIKHTYPHNAANEYVACWLAGKLSVQAPKAFLLSPDKRFNCEYAVAIEYIDGLGTIDAENLTMEMKEDLCGQLALNQLIENFDDVLQFGQAGGHIYSFDFSEALVADNMLIKQCFSNNEDDVVSIIRQYLSIFKSHLFTDFSFPGAAKEYHLDRQKEITTEIAKRVLSITQDDISEMSDEIGQLYNDNVAVYYECCIEEMDDRGLWEDDE